MIARIIAVDPRPRPPKNGVLDDVVVYQVPEHSRAYELLIELLDSEHIEHTRLDTPLKPKKPPKPRKPRTKKVKSEPA